MDTVEDIHSILNSLQSKIEDLEIRANQLLMKQLQTKTDLQRIQQAPEDMDEYEFGETTDINFPEDYNFEAIQDVLKNMMDSQKSWLDSVDIAKYKLTGLKGLKIFDEMNNHLLDRLGYLEMAKSLIVGPIIEEPPPPPEPEPEPEDMKEKAGKGKKGKKAATKKGKK